MADAAVVANATADDLPMSTQFIYPSVRAAVSEQEWTARVELAAFYRAVARYGMTDLTNNHITLKVRGAEDQFLINPFGLHYGEITASSLLKIDSAGEILLRPDPDFGINYTGFVIHGAIHAARPEIACVVHTHTRAGIAVSCLDCGLLMLNQTSLSLHGVVGYHDFEGLALRRGEQERLAADLGGNYALILRNHGLLACGRTVAEAFVTLYALESSCRIQLDVLAAGRTPYPLTETAIDAVHGTYERYRRTGAVGALEWAAELRWLDRYDPSYRN